MKKLVFAISFFMLAFMAKGQELNTEVFNVINLNYEGLSKVKELHAAGKDKEAAAALLDYYRKRQGISHPDVDLNNVKITKEEQKWADDGLKHVFFVHKGYQPSYHYGDDINWQYWPVKDNELRWQLHRTKWWQPMGKAYFITKDEKYAKEWVHQYMDWIEKNPLILKKYNNEDPDANVDLIDNVRFAWRPLEVSHRVQDQTIQFLLFLNSPHFTPEFLSQFLVNYSKHAEHILKNYSKQGNHLLFEAQRELYAGVLFPEFKNAPTWRKSGIDILNREIKIQVYEDGMQYELDPHYHLAAINIFAKAISIADANGFRDELPGSYFDTVEKMIMIVINTFFPDYTNPMFSDAKLDDKRSMLRNYRSWAKMFPRNEAIRYMRNEHKKGTPPANLSIAFKPSGFFVFRNGWETDATQMTLKAGPPAFWHNQPDNGTFELYINGRNFFPDAGSYVYGGDKDVLAERNWFRQTMVHKTLTLDNANLDSTDTKCLLWETTPKLDKLVLQNPSYKGLDHRRSVFFVDQKFFVIVDEAIGDAKGNVAIHYQMCEGKVNVAKDKLSAATQFEDKNNVLLQCFPAQPVDMVEEEGWVSYAYRKKAKREAFAFTTDKKDNTPVRFITVIMPVENEQSAPKIQATFENKQFDKNGLKIKVEVGKKKYNLNYTL
ncbi:heparin-sulfate lyase HepC [Dysgonomonas sp. 511]|uniref:heparin-sulfate lyase HepC n=1 Tax=Dysgonomonas sp. 511 TaxID=2302930 RepID=UPI0013D77ED7|nr:heparin-sulfate lyase HepC [Dysgonomonas sp. 511]NDV79507.1 heparinase [Dysgonomonas sp. 511]